MGALTLFVLVGLLAPACSAHRHHHRHHSNGKEYPMEGSQLSGDAAGLARALSGNEVEKADVMREVLTPGEAERARADLEMAATEEDAAHSPSSSSAEAGEALGEDVLNIAKMQQNTQNTANFQADRNQQLAAEDEALVRKVKYLRQRNHLLRHQVKLGKADLGQAEENMANKVKAAFKTFLRNTQLLRDELGRDGKVLQKDAEVEVHLKQEVNVQAEELASAKKRIEQQWSAKEAADAKAKENNAKWQQVVVNLTDSFQADEKSITRLRVLRELDAQTIDKGAAMLRDLKKDSAGKQKALAERLAKSEDDRQAERGALADQIAATKKQHDRAESARGALLTAAGQVQEKLKAENSGLEQKIIQKEHAAVLAKQELVEQMHQQESQYKGEMTKMTGAFTKAGQDILKIEKIDRGLVQKLNSSRTEAKLVGRELAAAKAESVTLTNQTKTLLASNKALLEKLTQLKEEKAAEPPPPPPPAPKKSVEEEVAEEYASRKREREVAATVAAEQASHNKLARGQSATDAGAPPVKRSV